MVSAPHDEKDGVPLNRGDGLNFDKVWRIPFQPFALGGKPRNYYDRTRKGLGYVTLLLQSEPESNGSLPSQSLNSSSWDFDYSVGVVFKKLFLT